MPISRSQGGKRIMVMSFAGIVVWLLLRGPILQDMAYHNFSDGNTVLGIPNFWNVVSNLPFLLIGSVGLVQLQRSQLGSLHATVVYAGILMVGLGSGYYHLNPTNETLVWDRLPMTVCFMALFSVLLRDFMGLKQANTILALLLIVGVYSILHWVYFEDLRPYVLVQFFPMLSIPVILLTHKSKEVAPRAFWVLLGWYVVAKGAEAWDVGIHDTLQVVSGHSLKHVFAAVGLFSFFRMTKN